MTKRTPNMNNTHNTHKNKYYNENKTQNSFTITLLRWTFKCWTDSAG